MLNEFLSKIRLFLAENSESKLFQDVTAELTGNNTITISIAVSKTVYQKLATLTAVNDHFLLDMSPASIDNSYFTRIVRGIIEACS